MTTPSPYGAKHVSLPLPRRGILSVRLTYFSSSSNAAYISCHMAMPSTSSAGRGASRYGRCLRVSSARRGGG
eukprot:7316859-Prymnesium_polylepis.1